MKDFIKWLKIWTGMLVVLVIGGVMTYFGIKARSDSKTTTDDHPNTLYVSPNETLTAAKRNSLADRNRVYDSGRFDVSAVSCAWATTTDSTRNYYKVSHNLNTEKVTISVLARNTDGTVENQATPYYQFSDGGGRRFLWYWTRKIDNNNFYVVVRCSWWYARGIGLDRWNNGTAWKYRVVARTF